LAINSHKDKLTLKFKYTLEFAFRGTQYSGLRFGLPPSVPPKQRPGRYLAQPTPSAKAIYTR